MNRIERIQIEGYRRLRSVDVELRPLNVMIGANGVGKTSFLEALSLLGASTLGRLQAKISELGGFDDILTRTRATADALKAMKFVVTEHTTGGLVYTLELAPGGISYVISNEHLHRLSKSDTLQELELTNGKAAPSVEEMPRHYLETDFSRNAHLAPPARKFRQFLGSSTLFGPIDVKPRAEVRLPQSVSPTTLPGANGEDLVGCLYTLRENNPDRFELIEDTLKAAFPDFERLGFPPVAAGMMAVTWKDKNFSKPIYMHQLSEGTLRFLWLIALLYSPDLPAITLIDEPEVSLHPELLSILVDVFREASTRSQIIVATHSDRLIRFCEPEEVLVFDSEEGYATTHWADNLDVTRWLSRYTLDQVWQMGQLGGRA